MVQKKIIFKILIFLSITEINGRIYINSIPKCGTHLLEKCISNITQINAIGFPTEKVKNDITKYLNNKFFHCHLPYNKNLESELKKANYKVFFIYRDPRDQIISNAFWILEKPSRYLEKDNPPEIFSNDLHQLINLFIRKINGLYNEYLPWINSSIVLPIKFENLIGVEGNGSREKQYLEIKKICSHLNLNSVGINKSIEDCIKNLFGGTGTFRKGQIGSWKKHFTEKQKRDFKNIAGKLLIKLGYESNLEW